MSCRTTAVRGSSYRKTVRTAPTWSRCASFEANPGSLQPYAGAGVNRAQYFGAAVDRSPAWLSPRNLYGDVGAAAEAGAELRVSERLLFTADLRWADFDDEASALRGPKPVAADPLVLGFSVGYRFR